MREASELVSKLCGVPWITMKQMQGENRDQRHWHWHYSYYKLRLVDGEANQFLLTPARIHFL